MSEYKVLIPLDGSPMAEHALAFLPALSRVGQLDVTLVSVTDIPEDVLEIAASEDAAREHNLLDTYMRETAATLEGRLGGGTVKAEILRGDAATRILEAATETAPDLLVISTHGRSGIARLRRGAVADKVIRGAPCSVLVVGPRAMQNGKWLDEEAEPPFQRILVPLDGSDTAKAALAAATELARVFNARIHLIQVMPYVPLASGFWSTPATLWERALEHGTRYFSSVAEELDVPGGVTTSVKVGSPSIEIDTYIHENDIDLVVMTTQGRGGLARAALGSVTDRVIGSGPPVLVVRPQQA